MSELPKSVVQRLAATADPEEHPSADLLAAFSEQALVGDERQRLLSHLAACAPCRETLWRALPEEAMAQPAASAASRGWAWSPAWRWVGVAAGIVVLAGVALLFRGGPGPAAEKVASAPKPPLTDMKRDSQVVPAKPAAPLPSAEARLDVRNKTAPAPRLQAKAEIASETPRASRQTASRQAASANVLAGQQMLAKSADQVAAGALAAAPAAPAVSSLDAARAKPVPSSTAEAGVIVASNIPLPPMGKKKLAPPTRWMLSPEGALLRSTDAGKNWQAVPFAGTVVFHTVAVVGSEVWVGGQDGALYCSPDDGSQWQHLSLSAAGAALKEDILSLAFQDAEHGTLTTASGQIWATSDGGRSWQKQ